TVGTAALRWCGLPRRPMVLSYQLATGSQLEWPVRARSGPGLEPCPSLAGRLGAPALPEPLVLFLSRRPFAICRDSTCGAATRRFSPCALGRVPLTASAGRT